MDNRKKKRNKQKNRQNPNTNTNINTEVLNTEAEKKDNVPEIKTEEKEDKAVSNNIAEKQQKNEKSVIQKTDAQQKNGRTAADHNEKQNIKLESTKIEKIKKEESLKESIKKKTEIKEAPIRETQKKESHSVPANGRTVTDFSSEHIKGIALNSAKVLLPVAACAILIAVIISYVGSRENQTVNNTSLTVQEHSDAVGPVTLSEEPLAENAYTSVNDLMRVFYTALADGDMDTVRKIKDYNTDREIITYEKKSEFIESYDNVDCYTKPGMEENSYFVYVTYDVKIKDIETKAPGLNAFYVYTADDGSLRIDGDTEESVKAAFKLVTSQDDVVDLYNKIDVNYTEATASDEALDQFMTELPSVIKESVGVALARLETQDENGDVSLSEVETEPTAETEVTNENEEPLQNQTVNQIVRTTDTVNVRSSDSEEADRIGKAQTGTELKRIEDRINGWSKVIFEDKEAFIKSDYLEVVADEGITTEPVGTITAMTNVNVRSQASQDSERLGSAQAGNSYVLLEDQGEWYKIDYNGAPGFVKAEYFQR